MCVCARVCATARVNEPAYLQPPMCPFLVWGANSLLVFELLIGNETQELRLREKKMGCSPSPLPTPPLCWHSTGGWSTGWMISLKEWGGQGFW